MTKQKTIKDPVEIEGTGLQTGAKARLRLKGSPANSGINFIRTDLANKPLVNIASLGARTGRPGVGVNYAASKAGLLGITKCLAKELGTSNIYVNAICPGPILTDQTRQYPKEVFDSWNAGRAVPKDGYPEDVADAVIFLASGRSDWVTGVTLDVNGGIFIG